MALFSDKKATRGVGKGQRKELIAIRLRPDQYAYLDEARRRGWGITEVMRTVLDVWVDLERELGEDLRRARAAAAAGDTTLGTALARAVKAGLATLEQQVRKTP